MIQLLLVFLMLSPILPGPRSYDTADQEFRNMHYVRAIALYDSLLSRSTDTTAVFWRMSRVLICYGDTADKERKFDLYTRAVSYALRAVRADSASSDAHAWLAAAYGNIAMFEGGKTKVRLAHSIKREVDRAIELDANNDVAYSILGSFHRAIGDVSWIEKQLAYIFLGGLPEGGYDGAEAAFRRAIQLAPNVVRNHFELGLVYVSLERNSEALSEFRKVRDLQLGVAADVALKRKAERQIKELEQ